MVVLGVLSALLVPALVSPLHYDVEAVGRLIGMISPLVALPRGVAGFVIHRRRNTLRPPR